MYANSFNWHGQTWLPAHRRLVQPGQFDKPDKRMGNKSLISTAYPYSTNVGILSCHECVRQLGTVFQSGDTLPMQYSEPIRCKVHTSRSFTHSLPLRALPRAVRALPAWLGSTVLPVITQSTSEVGRCRPVANDPKVCTSKLSLLLFCAYLPPQ